VIMGRFGAPPTSQLSTRGIKMETKFFASIRSKAGRILFASQAHASREDAARECFAARPKAHEASTSRAGFINGEYRDCGSDIQWIQRRNVVAGAR